MLSQVVEFTDMNRSATILRLYGVGVLHFGAKFVPSFRLGVGPRLSRHVMDGSDTTDTEWQVGLALIFGAGLDIAVTDRLSLGTAVSYDSVNAGDDTLGAQGLSASLQLGWSWP